MAFKIGILGSGGQADEAVSYLQSDTEVIFNAINKEYITNTDIKLIDIVDPSDYEKTVAVVAAVGAPSLRRDMVSQWAGERYTVIHAKDSYVNEKTLIGEGTIIAPGVIVTTSVSLGAHNIINISATVSHNSILGDFVTVSPGAHIAGNVSLGNGVFVGIGATVSNGVKIADGCVIGAGAVVLNDVDIENSVVVGIPAETIRINEGWLREL